MDDLFDEDILKPAPEADGMVILSVANAYKKQYYLNPKFAKLPETIQEELQIMCVLYTADVGGILLGFDGLILESGWCDGLFLRLESVDFKPMVEQFLDRKSTRLNSSHIL